MNNTAVLNNQAVNTNEAKKFSAAEVLLIARCFLPILSTIGALLIGMGGEIAVLLGALFTFIGTVSALTVCPLKLISFPIKCGFAGFRFCRAFIPVYGVADLCAAVFGLTGGIMVGLAAVIFAPAVFTIKKFL